MNDWKTLVSPNTSINLLGLTNGKTANLGVGTLPAGTYQGFRLIIDTDKSSITLNDGTKPEVKWPGAGKHGIKINLDEPVIIGPATPNLLIDFDVASTFADQKAEDRRNHVGQLRQKHPTGVVSISVTYYTGMVDTVAHVPDRCVTADGYEPKSYQTVKWPIGRDLPSATKKKGDNVEVRYINFEDQTGTSNVTRSITYFFHCNGDFVSDPLGVRARLANLMHQRLTPSQGERSGRPTASICSSRPKVAMSEATQRRLAELAEEMSTPEIPPGGLVEPADR